MCFRRYSGGIGRHYDKYRRKRSYGRTYKYHNKYYVILGANPNLYLYLLQDKAVASLLGS